jgi:hypothetical protein
MVELDFNPQAGERVQRSGSLATDELYEIVDRHANAAGEFLLKLKRVRDGKLFDNISPLAIDYPADERVRRELKNILAHFESLPDDFQEGRFDVKWDEMYDETPRIMVYFYLKPEVIPSVAKARIWTDFYAKLQERLEPLTDAGTWLQFTAREDRSALSAAS